MFRGIVVKQALTQVIDLCRYVLEDLCSRQKLFAGNKNLSLQVFTAAAIQSFCEHWSFSWHTYHKRLIHRLAENHVAISSNKKSLQVVCKNLHIILKYFQ